MPFWEAASKIGGAVLALALVLCLAWLVLRWMNGRVPGTPAGQARPIKVLDRLAPTRGSTVLLLRVKDRVLLVAISDHEAKTLYAFDDESHTFAAPEAPAQNFTKVLADAAKRLTGRSGGNGGDRP